MDLHAFGCKIVYMRAKVDRFFQKRAGLFILSNDYTYVQSLILMVVYSKHPEDSGG